MTPSTAIQRPDLGMALDEFDLEASRQGFVGLKVFPEFPVVLQSANFSRVKIGQLLKTYPTARAPGAGYSRGQGEFVQDFYACSENGHEEPVDDREAKIYAYTLDAEIHATQTCRDVILRGHEKRVAAKVFDTATFTGANFTLAVTVKWSAHATATPVDDVTAGIIKVRNNFGIVPNVLVLPWLGFKHVRQCQQIIDRIKYSGRDDPKNVTTQVLAELFDVEEVVVPGAQFNGANEPAAASLSEVWDPTMASLARVARDNNLKRPCLGRTFHFTEDGSSLGGAVEEYREERARSSVVRSRMDTDEKLINKECGFLFSNIT